MKDSIPTKIIGFGETLTVELTDALSSETLGHIDYTNQVIRLSEQYNSKTQLSTLIHELIHYVDHFSGMGLEENKIEAMENGLVALMKLNKQFFKNIIEGL